MTNVSATRLYASSIAIVSGIYAMTSAVPDATGMPTMGEPVMGAGELIMLGIGIVVLVHGIVLLTPAAFRIGQASGPLMMTWAVIMLGNQLLFGAVPGSQMPGMRWDAGMAAIALLMLISGLIMTSRRSENGM